MLKETHYSTGKNVAQKVLQTLGVVSLTCIVIEVLIP